MQRPVKSLSLYSCLYQIVKDSWDQCVHELLKLHRNCFLETTYNNFLVHYEKLLSKILCCPLLFVHYNLAHAIQYIYTLKDVFRPSTNDLQWNREVYFMLLCQYTIHYLYHHTCIHLEQKRHLIITALVDRKSFHYFVIMF